MSSTQLAFRRHQLSVFIDVPERLLDSFFENSSPFLSDTQSTLARAYYGFGIPSVSKMTPVRAQLGLTSSGMTQAFRKLRLILREVAEETYFVPSNVLKQTCRQFFSHARAKSVGIGTSTLQRIKKCVTYGVRPPNPCVSFLLGHSELRAREMFAFSEKTFASVKVMLGSEGLRFREDAPGVP